MSTRHESSGLSLNWLKRKQRDCRFVASNVQGIPEVFEGTDSIMVQPDDPKALREAVMKTLHHKPGEKTQAIGKGLKRTEDFRIGKQTDAMINHFEDVLLGRF